MDDCIERKEALQDLLDNATILTDRRLMKTDVVVAILEHIPAADMRPVVRARWIFDKGSYGERQYHCSECGEITKDTVMNNPRANYCPWCGATMKEETQNGN